MSMTADFRDALGAAPDVAAIVADRVFRDERLQGTPLPALVIYLISDPRPMAFDGPQSIRPSRLQVDCLAASRWQADALADAVIAASERRQLAAANPRFESARIINVRGDSNAEAQPTTFRTAIDVMVWHH